MKRKKMIDEIIFQNTEKLPSETWERVTVDELIDDSVPVGGVSISKSDIDWLLNGGVIVDKTDCEHTRLIMLNNERG